MIRHTLLAALVLAAAPAVYAQGADTEGPYRHAHAFRSPSGNIHCIGDREWTGENRTWNGVECQISGRLNERPAQPRPQDCDTDWGDNFSISRRGKTEMGCVGDTLALPDSRVLRYGETVRGKGWQCTSRRSGMRCTNSERHGFDLSRRRQQLF